MSVAEIFAEVRKTSPNTLFEILCTGLLLLLGLVAVLDPDSIAFIQGIDPDPVLQQVNGIQSIALLISAIVPTLGTTFYRSIVSND